MALIYVSSTFLDLQEYREKIRLVLRRMGHSDVAMEYYVAEDQRPVDKCLTDVAACDLYIGIFAWRYGWISVDSNPDRISITEMEYRHAERNGKPCLIFLLSDDAPWPRRLMDKDLSNIERFRSEIAAKHLSGPHFTSAEDLGRLAAEAINEWEKTAGFRSSHRILPELNLSAYFAALTKRYQRLDLDTLTPPEKEEYLQLQLRSVFVEQNVRENPPPIELPKEVWEKLQDEKEIHPDDLPIGIDIDDVLRAREAYYGKPLRPVLDILADANYRHSILLGDPGSGKSTLARYILLSLIGDSGDEKFHHAFEGYLPLLIELRSYAGLCAENKCDTFLEFLDYLGKTEDWGLNKEALQYHLKNEGRAVVIFDGLDEVFDPADRERITRQIVGFASSYPNTRIIVTSRIIGYRRKILSDADFIHFTLQDLDEMQVKLFIDRWYAIALRERPNEADARRDRIMQSFSESASIRQLAGNPMLLTIMAIIGKNQELPRERWKLYDHAASVLIQHWDVNKHLKDQKLDADFIGEEDKKELLRRLAYSMQAGTGGLAGNYIHREQLQIEFENYLSDRYSQTPDRAKAIAVAMIEQFRRRNFILSLYGANLYGFVHRAFLEYFCATAFVHRFEKQQEMSLAQLKDNLYGTHWEDRSWHEVLRLICGMIDTGKAGEIIAYLANEERHPRSKYSRAHPPWNIALAIQCLGEMRNLARVGNASKQLLEVVCSLFDFGMANDKTELSRFIDLQIATPLELIGSKWPYRTILVKWLRERAAGKYSWAYAESFGKFIGSVGEGQSDIHNEILYYATHHDENYRVLVPFSISRGWRDDRQSLPLLRNYAVKDTSKRIRQAAVEAIKMHYQGDSKTLPLLRDRAMRDASEDVRRAAIEALSTYYRADPKTVLLLRDRAFKDISWGVRRVSIAALGTYYHDTQTASYLHTRATLASDWNTRRDAITALAAYFRDDLKLLTLFHDRAIKDSHPLVREAAVEAIKTHYLDDMKTLPLLRNRAVKDSSEYVRKPSLEALSTYYRDDPRTVSLLCDRAVSDEAMEIRRLAISVLIKHYRENSRTLPVLIDRAVNDDAPSKDSLAKVVRVVSESNFDGLFYGSYVRDFAIKALAAHWANHWETLPLLFERAKTDKVGWLREEAKRLIENILGYWPFEDD